MSNGVLKNQDRSYRRGLVLGLTIAEIIILIIFSLLLALAAVIAKQKKEIAERDREIAQVKTRLDERDDEIVLLNEQLKLIRRANETNSFDDLFTELELARKRAAKLEREVNTLPALQEKAAVLDEIEKALSESPQAAEGSMEQKIRELTQQAARGQELIEALKEAGVEGEDQSKISENAKKMIELAKSKPSMADLTRRLKEAEEKDRRRQGQLKNMQRKLAGIGQGTEMPACWANPGTGKPEYIFDVALTSSGLIARDNAIPHRAGEQAKLPIQSMSFEREISPPQFLVMTRALFDWSVKNECRFFIRAFDLTGATEKSVYKRHLRIAAARFYYFEPRDEQFRRTP